jgi:predicted metal-dependent hydrolase
MSIEAHRISVSGLSVDVVRKGIKNLHLGVYPPAGRVRVAAPLAMSDDAVRLAVISRLSWIRRQRSRFAAQARQSAREMVSGESHYVFGRRYRLRVVEDGGPARVVSPNNTTLELHVQPGTDAGGRERVLHRWYRGRLRELVPPLLAKWEAMLGVEATGWGIRRMKTRWGTCNPQTRRIWFNLELAKKPVECLEYLVVHELVHLLERRHTERFIALMDRHLPEWRLHRQTLNAAPLGHTSWSY